MNPFIALALGYALYRWATSSSEPQGPGPQGPAPQAPAQGQPAGWGQPSAPSQGQAQVSPTTPAQGQVSPTTPAQGQTPSGGYKIKDRQRLDAAAVAASKLAPELQQKGKSANKALIREFQRLAGLEQDGVYGPKTAGALRWYTMSTQNPKGLEIPPHVGAGYSPYAPQF